MKKWMEWLYSILFIVLLLLPLVTMNFKTNQISEIDNTKLPELELSTELTVENITEYVNARIGFRTEALDMYQWLNANIFGIMEHPMYMYGKNGHVFMCWDSYISDFQHLNLDSVWASEFAKDVEELSDIAHEQGAEFIYMLIPDKKTVYAEYFPDAINVKGDISRTDQVLEALARTDVDWIYMKEIMLEGKQKLPVCNVLFDAAHWNENGAFLCYQNLYTQMQKYFPCVQSLKQDDFEVSSKLETSLLVSRFVIHEEVPQYTLKGSRAIADNRWLEENLPFLEERLACTRYINPSLPDMPKLLVFHDSYMIHHEKFFTENFSEVIFIHRENLVNIEIYETCVECINPDIVIYENPERVFPITFE